MMLKLLSLLALAAVGMCQRWETFSAKFIDISARGNEVWAIDTVNNIFRYENGEWAKKPGQATKIAATVDGYTWMVNGAMEVYRWNVNTLAWDRMPGAMILVSAGSRELAAGINKEAGIFKYKDQRWEQLRGAAYSVSIGIDEELWHCNSDQYCYRWANGDWQWQQGAALTLDVQDSKHIVSTNKQNQIQIWTGTAWKVLKGLASKVSINNKALYIISFVPRASSAWWSLENGSGEESFADSSKKVQASDYKSEEIDATSIVIDMSG